MTLPELSAVVVMLKESIILNKLLNKTPITVISPDMSVYMDLRALGAGLYELLNLPNCNFETYVVVLDYISWQNSKHTRVNCEIPALQLRWTGKSAVSHTFVKWWGSITEVSNKMTVISNDFIRDFNIIDILKENDVNVTVFFNTKYMKIFYYRYFSSYPRLVRVISGSQLSWLYYNIIRCYYTV